MIDRIRKTINKFNKINILKISIKQFSGTISRVLILFVGLVLTEYFYHLSIDYRTWFMFSLIFLTCFLVIHTIIKIVKETAKYRQDLRSSAKNIELFMEGKSGILQLLDLISIKQETSKEEDTSIVDAAISTYEEKFTKEILPVIFPAKELLKSTRAAIFLIVVSAILLSLTTTGEAAKRLIYFRTNFLPPLSHTITLLKTESAVLEGDSLLLSCKIKGVIPDKIDFLKRNPNTKKWSSVTITPKDSIISYLNYPVTDNFYYFFKTTETSSDTARIDIIKHPRITTLETSITPPRYSGLPREVFDEITGDITALKGSNIKFKLSTNSSCDSVKIFFQKGKRITSNKLIAKGDNIYQFQDKLNYSADFYFTIYATRAGQEIESRKPVRYHIEIIEDEYPTVKLISPQSDYQLGKELTIPLVAAARDDYGIRSFFLYKKKIQNKEFLKSIGAKDNEKFKRQTLEFEKMQDGTYAVSAYTSLENMWLLPEDKAELFVRVYDNDNISGPKYSDSEHITVTLPSLDQMFEQAETKYEKQTKDVAKNLAKSKNLKKMIKELSRELKVGKNLNWENKKKIEQAINEHKKMLKSIEDIEKSIKENIEKLDKNSMLSKETMSKYMKLQKMVDQLFNEDLKQRLEKLSATGENKDLGKKELDKMLEEFDAQQKKFQEGLEKTMKILQQIQQEYRLDKLLKKFNDLIKKQQNINLNLKDEAIVAKNIAQKEEKLEKSYKKAIQDIEKMKEELEQTTSKTGKQLAKITDKAANNKIDNDFKKFAKNMTNGKREQASTSGKQIEDKLADLAADLADAKESFINEQKEELDQEIKNEIANLLKLSFLTEDLKNESRSLSKKSPKAKTIIIRNSRIEKSFTKVSNKIFEISGKTFFIDNSIGAKIGQINKYFEEIKKYMGDRKFYLTSRVQSHVMVSINKLIQLLEKVRSDIEKSKSPSGLQEMIEKMEQMAKKQSELNSQSKGMMNMPGMSSGQGKGESGKQSGGMSQLAEQQAALYQALQEMMEQMGMNGQQGKPGKDGKPGNDGSPGKSGKNGMHGSQGEGGQNGTNGNNGKGKGSGKRGNGLGKKLSGLGDSMKDLLQKMKDKKMNESILKRQDKLLKHMLETVKSMKRERISDKRESKGDNLRAIDPGKIDLSDPENSLREKLIRSLNDGYNRKYRKKIKEYFESIE